MPVSKAAKVMKIGPKAAQNHEKMGPGIMRIANFVKVVFLQYLSCQMLGFQIPDMQIQTQKPSEKYPGNNYEEIHRF